MGTKALSVPFIPFSMNQIQHQLNGQKRIAFLSWNGDARLLKVKVCVVFRESLRVPRPDDALVRNPVPPPRRFWFLIGQSWTGIPSGPALSLLAAPFHGEKTGRIRHIELTVLFLTNVLLDFPFSSIVCSGKKTTHITFFSPFGISRLTQRLFFPLDAAESRTKDNSTHFAHWFVSSEWTSCLSPPPPLARYY
ncbi:unnamed protein product [Gadus morhua 'NCC']